MPKNPLMSITSSIVLVLKEDINFINLLSSSLSIKTRLVEVEVEITIYSIVISSVWLFELLELVGAILGNNPLGIERYNYYYSYDSY